MSRHTVAVTFTGEAVARVWEVDAVNAVHACIRVFFELPKEKHAAVVRILVSQVEG